MPLFISVDTSFLFSAASLLISVGVLTIYFLRYKQQDQQLRDQRRQIETQEKQLDTQQTQLEQQERQLTHQERQIEQKEREIEQFQEELEQLTRQTTLAELEHQPHLEVEDYRFEGDRVVILLSNYGNGVATNLRLETILNTSGFEHSRPMPAMSNLRRRESDDASLNARAIGSGEQCIEFEGEAIVGLEGPTGSTHQRSFRGVMMDLQYTSEETDASIEFSILAESLAEEEESVLVTTRPLPLAISNGSEPINLETAVSRVLQF